MSRFSYNVHPYFSGDFEASLDEHFTFNHMGRGALSPIEQPSHAPSISGAMSDPTPAHLSTMVAEGEILLGTSLARAEPIVRPTAASLSSFIALPEEDEHGATNCKSRRQDSALP